MTMLPFPPSLAEKYQPKRLKDFIGIARPLAIVRALAAKPYRSAWFFLGASGLGKTSLAFALANEINAEIHHVPSQKCVVDTIDDVCRSCHRGAFNFFGPNAGKPCLWHAVVVDEADRMSMAAQLALLSKLDNTNHPPNTIFIFTANSAQGLEDRFLSRCRVLVFEQDTFTKELPLYLQKVYKAETRHTLPLSIAEKIAADSSMNVRDALMTLEVEIMARAA